MDRVALSTGEGAEGKQAVEREADHSPVVENKWSSKLLHVFMARRGTTSPLSS